LFGRGLGKSAHLNSLSVTFVVLARWTVRWVNRLSTRLFGSTKPMAVTFGHILDKRPISERANSVQPPKDIGK
jgi:hypothetical protein